MRFIKTILAIIFISIMSFSIYLFIPHKSDRLLYIPSINEKNYKESLNLQQIPLNSFDYYILRYFFTLNKSKWIRVPTKISKYKLFKKIKNSSSLKTRTMIIYPGSTIKEFAKQISNQANLNKDKLISLYKKLSPFTEAGVVATKYKIPYNTTEQATIAYMIYKSNSFFKEIAKRFNTKITSKEFKNKLIVASILEKETHQKDEMPYIASVIYNRLKKDIKLQLDATLNYGKNSHTIITPKIIRDDNSAYNTYKYKGLPPNPLGSISKTALYSAFLPAKTNYLYFVKNGEYHIFSSNYSTHKNYVKKYKQYLKKIRTKKISKILKDPIKIDFTSFLNFKPNLLTNKLKLK